MHSSSVVMFSSALKNSSLSMLLNDLPLLVQNPNPSPLTLATRSRMFFEGISTPFGFTIMQHIDLSILWRLTLFRAAALFYLLLICKVCDTACKESLFFIVEKRHIFDIGYGTCKSIVFRPNYQLEAETNPH